MVTRVCSRTVTGSLSIVLCGLSAVAAFAPSAARADVFQLKSGGKLEGTLVNADEKPRTQYVVRTAPGALITLSAEQVADVVQPSAVQTEYEAVRHQHADTPDGHMALADWCRDNKLLDLRTQHLERIIELDPDHRTARSQLGYNKIGGQWRTREEHMAALGKIQHKGEWLYPQEIEINEAKTESNKLKTEWIANLRRWKEWMGGPKELVARESILAIADPAAVPALKLAVTDEKQPENVRVLYVRALARIATYDAMMQVAERSLLDPSAEVRATCRDLLVADPQPSIVNYFIQQLRSSDNTVLNRAAYTLRMYKDDRAVGPLIDALVTKHKFTVVSGGSGMSVTNSNFGSGFSTGSSSKTFVQEAKNQEVLDALLTIIGGQVNYQYNVEAWKHWFAGLKKSKFAARRSDF